METNEIKMLDLPAMRVASVIGFGPSPEPLSIQKMVDWAKPLGLLAPEKAPRFFGFNNPDPSPGSPNYGYETWLVVGPQVQPAGEIKIKEVPAYQCAVLYCPSVEVIMQYWHRLVTWVETSPYRMEGSLCLEETFFKDFESLEPDHFNLWLPVVR